MALENFANDIDTYYKNERLFVNILSFFYNKKVSKIITYQIIEKHVIKIISSPCIIEYIETIDKDK